MKTNKINTALRISAVILVMTMLLQFFGCSGGGETLSDPEEMYSFISENAAFPSMEDVDAEAVRDIYGIDLDKISRYVLRISEDKSIADEVAIFETADPSICPRSSGCCLPASTWPRAQQETTARNSMRSY